MSAASSELAAGFERLRTAVSSGAAFQYSSAVALFAMGTVGSFITQVGLFDSLDNFIGGALVAVVLNLSISIMVVIIYVLWIEDRPPRPFWIMALLAPAFGVGRMALSHELQAAVGVPSLMRNWIGYGAGAMQGVLWMVTLSLFFQDRDRFNLERSALLRELADNRLRERSRAVLTNALTEELTKTVSDRVAASVSATRSSVATALTYRDSAAALRSIAASLRSTIDEEIRPMSRELWRQQGDADVQMNWRTLLTLSCYRRPFATVTSGLYAIAFGWPLAMSMTHPVQAAICMLVQILLGAMTLQLIDQNLRIREHDDAVAYWMSLVVLAFVVTAPTIPLVALGWPQDDARLWSFTALIGYPLITFFSSIVNGLAGTREAVLERVRGIVDETAVSREVRAKEMQVASQRLARHLHSSLQGRLMALSLELERAADQDRADISSDVLQRLDALLQAPMVGALEEQAIDVEAALRRLINEWSAVANVHLEYSVAHTGPLEQGQLIVGIAEEALANAVRHGHATEIDVRVTSSGPDVLVSIENNGTAKAIGQPGLGTRWLDQVSRSDFTLRPRGDGGMRLQVRLADVIPGEPV